MSNANRYGSLRRLYRHLSTRRRRQLALLLVLMFVGAMAELVSLGAVLPFLALMSDPSRASDYPLLGDGLSWVGWDADGGPLLSMTIIFSVVVLVAAAIRMLLSWASNKFVFMVGYDLGVAVYTRIMHQPYQFYVSRNTSEIIAIINNVQVIAGSVLLQLMQVLISAVIALAILVALMAIDAGTATVAGVGFASIYLIVTMIMRRRLRANSLTIARAQGLRVQSVQEGIGGIRNVLLDNTQAVYLEKFRSVDGPLREAQAANTFISAAPRYMIEGGGMVLIAVLAYGLSSESGGVAAALPVLGALALGAQKLLPLLQQMYHGWAKAVGNWALISDVVDLLDTPTPAEYLNPEPVEPLAFERSLRLENLHFRYDGDGAWVLRNLNVTIPRGCRCGIIGKTGGGKSTALDIIMGLLEPTEGRILVDDKALSWANRRAWQTRIAHVPQAIYLSDASVAENIALGVEPSSIDHARVQQAAKQAQISDFIESQPQGYAAVVGERGVRLSGGQRQRIAIARALYKRASVLILDEATSALDDATEKAVIECIEGLDRQMTVIIIAHRLSTVRSCDLVIKLEAGAVVAQGTYAEVVLPTHAQSVGT